MKNLKEEDIIKNFKNSLSTEFGRSGVLNEPGGGVEYLNFVSDIGESEKLIKKKKKKSNVTDLVGNKKMNLPIGKMTSMKGSSGIKSEPTEATSSGGSGQFSQPLFGKMKKDVTEKWSEKYKKSINCKNPKGFSQRAHCQGKKKKLKEEKLEGGVAGDKKFEDLVSKHVKRGKFISVMRDELKRQLIKGIKIEMEHTKDKKIAKEIAMDHLFEDPKYYEKLKKIEGKKTETKEATGASSAGAYVTPAAWAKSTKKKDWRGRSKTQIPGGKFVQVKKKCKKFPYCNQGDIKALKLFDHVKIKKIIKEVSENYGVSENVVKNIIAFEYSQYKSKK